jgi:ribosomal protein S19E (S16A)
MEHTGAAVAGRAIKLAMSEGSFKSEDVRRGFGRPPSRHTVRRVLRQLESDGWLTRESDESRIWRAGFQARALGDLSAQAERKAEREPVESGEERRGGFDL